MRTTGGTDLQAAVMCGPSNGTGAYAPCVYIGFTASSHAPSYSDTVLLNEIATGALVRAQAAYAHSAGTPSLTLSVTMTSDQSIEIQTAGVFNAATVAEGGTML
jgi:hypothetical protein